MNDVFTSLRRTPYQSLAAFFVLFFSLFLGSVLFLMVSFFHGLLTYVETRPPVTVYFRLDTQQSDILKTRDQLVSSNKVEKVQYVSKDEAFALYKEFNKNNPLLLEMLSANNFPASLEITAKDPMFLAEIADYVKTQPGVDEVIFQKENADRLSTLAITLRRITSGLFLFLVVMSIVVVSATMMFKVALKKDEVEILRLLGAGIWYVRKPFLLEATFLGFTAATVSFSLIFAALLYTNPFLSSYLQGIPQLSITLASLQIVVWPLNGIFLGLAFGLSALVGVGMAITAAFIATGKYIR